MRIEQQILSNLIYDEHYCRKVIPFVKQEYFGDRKESVIAKQIIDFFNKYNKTLTPEILAIEVSNAKGVTDKEVGDIGEFINTLKPNPDVNKDWLVENTEKFCKDRAVYLAIMQSIKIFEGKDPIHNQDAIPSLLSDALAVSFDSHIGHDYIEDFAERFEFYHRIEIGRAHV